MGIGPWIGDADEYRGDASGNLKRAAGLVGQKMSCEQLEDAVLQFAFGVERCFKAILASINPVFLLETPSVENAIPVLYRNQLKGRAALSKLDGLNSNTLGFKAAMLRAAKFSDEVESRIGLFTKLSDYRNTFAHGLVRDIPWGEAENFLGRVFWPTIETLSEVVQLDLAEIAGERLEQLKKLSERLIKEEQFAEAFEQKLAAHRALWETRKGDAEFVRRATQLTANDTSRRSSGDRHDVHTCPACDQDAVLTIEYDYDGSPGDWYLTGVFVTGLTCHFCDLEVTDQEEVDYLKLNEYLHDQ